MADGGSSGSAFGGSGSGAKGLLSHSLLGVFRQFQTAAQGLG